MGASAATPPAISSAPAAARCSGSPRRTESVVRPATGRTVNAAAAASGSTLQPAIRTKTRRNSTAVSEADTSASATIADRRPGSGLAVAAGASSEWLSAAHAHPAAAASAIGTWATKIACQSNACVSAPPSAGPAAAPAMAIVLQAASRRSSACSIAAAVATATAPPAP